VTLIDIKVPGKLEIDTGVMVSIKFSHNSTRLIDLQLRYGLSIQSWPCGVPTDSEEAIEFAEMENIDCMIEKFSLVNANGAFGRASISLDGELLLTMITDAMLKGTVRFRAVIMME
jgi:D-arabinose 1-dehydrogenase-like Zn-dependent alcohol dehydrogenase